MFCFKLFYNFSIMYKIVNFYLSLLKFIIKIKLPGFNLIRHIC